MSRYFLAGLLSLLLSSQVIAAEALVAVASNFFRVASELEISFEAETGHDLTLTTGSTGSLYAQIVNGAPYDVLLAADQERPRMLVQSGLAAIDSRFTFASGRLVLWSARPSLVQSDLSVTLLQPGIARFAIANPDLAPYGRAGREALQSLHAWDSVRDKIVMGQNIGQTHALVATGNAQAGLVALSQVLGHVGTGDAGYLLVPAELHSPIRQDAVLLRHGQNNIAAREFLRYLRSEQALTMIRNGGYDIESAH